MVGEIWKDIPMLEGFYQISNFGNVRSMDRVVSRMGLHPNTIKGKIMKFSINRDGYVYYRLYKESKKKMIFPQREVAKLFLQNPYNKKEVNHIDGNKLNNHFSNLEWATRVENMNHAFTNKLHDLNGERCANSKLSNNDVLNIRRLFIKNGKLRYKEIAMMYKVSPATIGSIVKSKTWKHINEFTN